MATYSKVFLSGGSANGRPIKVAATGTPGTLIHTADASAKDEIWLFAMNTDTVARKLTLEFGGTTSPDDLFEQTLDPEDGLVPVIAGLILSGGLLVRAFAASANVVTLSGFVNRIT